MSLNQNDLSYFIAMGRKIIENDTDSIVGYSAYSSVTQVLKAQLKIIIDQAEECLPRNSRPRPARDS